MRKVHLFTCLLCALLVMLLGATFAAAQTPVEIDFWHAMSGNNGEQTTALVADFNASHPNIIVTEQNKGNYNETLNAVIAAAGQGEGPNMAQIFDLGTPLAIDSGFFTPVETVLSEEQLEQVTGDIVAPLINYFTISDTLWSLPWNNSSPILYYNKDMFEEAVLDPD